MSELMTKFQRYQDCNPGIFFVYLKGGSIQRLVKLYSLNFKRSDYLMNFFHYIEIKI